MTGVFVISLDFELLWGVRDHADKDNYGKNVLNTREAIPRILDLFAENGISATWATVGFLFCEDKDELMSCLPEKKPQYRCSSLSNYHYLGEVGKNERDDPYYFAPSLIQAIADTPDQEIGTHTLSHFYCLEDGATVETFEADLVVAQRLARQRGITLKSIVFPRNQYGPEYLEVCRRQGLTHYRGNPSGWAYSAGKGATQTRPRRALRLLDAYTSVLGAHAFKNKNNHEIPGNVPASRFLRPCAGRLAPFHPRHIAVIKNGMTLSAKTDSGYHLWWHPHNFGLNTENNLSALRNIIRHFRFLEDTYEMKSKGMGDVKSN